MAAGASAVLFAVSKRPPVTTILRRYGLLVPLGMVLQLLFTSHVPFDWGVLQALGVGVVVSTLLAMAARSLSVVAGAAAVALVTGPDRPALAGPGRRPQLVVRADPAWPIGR